MHSTGQMVGEVSARGGWGEVGMAAAEVILFDLILLPFGYLLQGDAG